MLTRENLAWAVRHWPQLIIKGLGVVVLLWGVLVVLAHH